MCGERWVIGVVRGEEWVIAGVGWALGGVFSGDRWALGGGW